ncbi:MAG TPA: extensin, partial [Allosphingosinicella sp.]|nr:extensin [Allosphingosinicella sp.]
MRRAILLTLLLAACIPSSGRRAEPVARDRSAPAREILQCKADLAREGIRFKALPDRTFGNGCSA